MVGLLVDVSLSYKAVYTLMSSAKTLQISYIGMQTQEVAIKPNVKVVMKSDTELLDEVTVVAYGTKRKQDLVGSISSVKMRLSVIHRLRPYQMHSKEPWLVCKSLVLPVSLERTPISCCAV